jgi:hypothetical protein
MAAKIFISVCIDFALPHLAPCTAIKNTRFTEKFRFTVTEPLPSFTV